MRLLIGLLFSALAWGQTLTLTGPPTVRVGDNITLTLTLSAPSNSLAALQWTMGLPNGYIVTSANAGPATTTAGKTLYCNPAGTLCLTVGMNTNVYSVGVVATYQVVVPPSASPGWTTIPLSGLMGASLEGDAMVIVAGTAYSFVVPARSDLNGDGKTDGADLLIMVQEIIGGIVTHDQNGDGVANVRDAQIVARAAVQ